MSLYGMMRTGVSGMNAQANRLSTVADNIANAGTTGYKRSSTEFSSLIIPNVTGNYTSGGVTTSVRYATSQQGDLKYTTSTTDLAINGDGFFVVQDPSGKPFLTRAGSFVPDGDGRLVNAAGFYLMGYNAANGTPSAVTNGFGGLEPVLISQTELTAVPSKNGLFTANLPSDAAVVVAGNLPSAERRRPPPLRQNRRWSSTTISAPKCCSTSISPRPAPTPGKSRSTTRPTRRREPRSPTPPVRSPPQTLTFDPTNGKLTGRERQRHHHPGAGRRAVHARPGRHQPACHRLHRAATPRSTATRRAASTRSRSARTAPSTRNTRTARSRRSTASRSPRCRAPTSSTSSPATSIRKAAIPATSASASPMRAAWASVVSGALENSNVDIAEELTNMIESQRTYTANSKVFQTGADLMDILVNLKR